MGIFFIFSIGFNTLELAALFTGGLQGDGGEDDGLFGLIHEGFVQPGEYEIVARIAGVLPDSGEAFRRAWRGKFTVAAPGGFIAGEADWRALDTDDDGTVDAVLVEVPVSVDEPGDYTLTGRLRDAERDVEIHAVADFHREVSGVSHAVLHFRPKDLPQGQIFGPFALYNLKLFKHGDEGLVFVDHRPEASPVPVSLFNRFARSIRVTGDLNFGNVPVGQSVTRDLIVHNDGWEALEVSDLHLPPGFSASFDGVIEPEGSASIPVVFTPLFEGMHEGTLTIVSNAQTGESTLAISGQGGPQEIPLENWLESKGVPAGKRGPSDDPDGDGIPNVLAYLFNVHPLYGATSGDAYARPASSLDEDGEDRYLALTYRKNRNAAGLNIVLQASENLSGDSWQIVIPDQALEVGTDPSTGDKIIQVRVKLGTETRKFLRLRVAISES